MRKTYSAATEPQPNTTKAARAQDFSPGGIRNNLLTIERALESAGVIFISENGEGQACDFGKKPKSAADPAREIKALEADLASSGAVAL